MDQTRSTVSRPHTRGPLLGQPDRLPRWDVLELHVDEAAFLSTQWERAVESATHDLRAVETGIENRLWSHLEALTLAGPKAAQRVLLPAMAGDDPERIHVASVALLKMGARPHFEAVVRALVEGEPTARQAVQRALQLGWQEGLLEHLRPLLTTAKSTVRSAVLEVLRFNNLPPDPRLSEWMTQADEPALQATALHAACAVETKTEGAFDLRGILRSPDAAVRKAALVLGLGRGQRAAWQACQQQADARDDAGGLARLVLSMVGEDRDFHLLLELLQVPSLRANVLWALGFSGRLAAAEACLTWMHDEACAGLAAEAFCAIVGLRLKGVL